MSESISISASELAESVNSVENQIKGSVQLFSDIIGSSAWISNSYINMLVTLSGLNKTKEKLIDPDDHKFIIDKISKTYDIPENQYSEQEIFRSIYNELEYAHQHPDYKTPLKLPKIFPTIVLISGYLRNYIRQLRSERGVQHAAKISNLKYFVAKTDGFEGANIIAT